MADLPAREEDCGCEATGVLCCTCDSKLLNHGEKRSLKHAEMTRIQASRPLVGMVEGKYIMFPSAVFVDISRKEDIRVRTNCQAIPF